MVWRGEMQALGCLVGWRYHQARLRPPGFSCVFLTLPVSRIWSMLLFNLGPLRLLPFFSLCFQKSLKEYCLFFFLNQNQSISQKFISMWEKLSSFSVLLACLSIPPCLSCLCPLFSSLGAPSFSPNLPCYYLPRPQICHSSPHLV